jgi:pectate lyase
MLISLLTVAPASATEAKSSGITDASGWFESAYAEWTPVSGAESYNAYVSESDSVDWTPIDSALIRKYSNYYRVDTVGLKAGNYRIRIVPIENGAENTSAALTTDTLTVSAYDRSGYAHFNYSDGVGAYNDDGTLKEGAIVLYVTEANKDTVSVTSKDGTTVKGIGNILNSVGADAGGGKNSKGGIANTNAGIIRKLAEDGTPLVVRIIGNVSAPAGLTAYDSVDYGGSVGDNGFMARMSGGKNITIEGIGHDAVINGWGLHFICQSADYSKGYGRNFEVRNIAFNNVPEDCIGMEGQQEDSTLTAPVERCWIHHCTFNAPIISNPAESDKGGGDGACDFKRGQYFTNSYCYYVGYHKTNLVGSSDSSLQYHITYHHNYWKNCESRGPLARQANIHMYNNIFEGQYSYCMNPRANAYIFSEYNMFYASKNPVDVDSGAVKSYNDSFTSCTGNNHATLVTDRSTTVSTGNKYSNFDTSPTLSYIPTGDYVIQESISEMKAVVLAYAGTQKEDVITPEKVNASAIPASRYPTAALVLDYSKALNQSTVPASGNYDNVVFNVAKINPDYLGIGGTANGCDVVFYVNTAVNITVTQYADSSVNTVLCDESGTCLLVGSGTVKDLPAGYYFIQSNTYDVGSGKFKEAKISHLTVTAVDPNAATTPIPTPPPSGGGDNGGDNSGDNGGNTDNGGSVTSGTVITPESEVHSFTKDGKTDPEGFFTISGNTSTSKGSVAFNGEELTTCLKIETSTSISFNAKGNGTLVLVFGGTTSASGKGIKIDGTSYDIPSSQILEISLGAGSHSITKDDSINLFYLAFVPESEAQHEHNFSSEVTTDATCTEAGIITYTCSCSESYTEEIAPLGHKYDVEITPPTCTEAGYTVFSCFNCEFSYTDDEVAPLGHEWQDATTEAPKTCANCGATEGDKLEDVKPDDGETPDDGNTEIEDENNGATEGDDSDSTDGEEKLGFFRRIWIAIVDFFKKLFGKME